MLGDLADDVKIEADRLVLVVEEAERRRIELYTGDQFAPALDLSDRILGLGVSAGSNDGGACVSFNGGRSWSSIYNQKTAQFYRMDIDNQYPYRVYATQQDNTSISVPSASEWGVITLSDCTYPGTGESGFIAVHPEDPNIVYVGAVGSSPGGTTLATSSGPSSQ